MKIYDITQEIFSCVVYPGDTAPKMEAVRRTDRGDLYNLTDFSMCAHNGTHVDAPFHFLGDGATVEQIPLPKTVGMCYVAEVSNRLTAADAKRILSAARDAGGEEAAERILLKGDAIVTAEAAHIFAEGGIHLIGVESQSVGEPAGPMEVHKLLLGAQVVLLEGIRLSKVGGGVYFLNAAPIPLGGADGAPCRAILIECTATME